MNTQEERPIVGEINTAAPKALGPRASILLTLKLLAAGGGILAILWLVESQARQ
jgi:hypothetical protein